jgi:hypothetical protein
MQRSIGGERGAGEAGRAGGHLLGSDGVSLAVLGYAGLLLAACGADVRIESGAPDGGVAAAGSGGSGQGSDSGQTHEAPATGLEVLYEGEDNPSAIALDDRYVYWASLDVLRRAPLAGGAPVTLATGNFLRGMKLDGDHVYFFQSRQGAGSIDRVLKEGGESERLASALSPSALAIRGGDLFWSDSAALVDEGSINRLALDGSATNVMATGLTQPASLAIDGDHLYFRSDGSTCIIGGDSPSAECFGGGIQRLPLTGGAVEAVSASSPSGDFVLTDSGIYFLATSPPRIVLASLDGNEREVTGNLVLQGGITNDGSLRTDGAALYWADGDKVLRMPFDTEEVAPLVTELDGAYDVAVRGDWVYVAESGAGRILRVATDGSANRPAGPITGPCPAPLGSAEELAATPRADEDLEALALSLEPERMTASPATHDRVASDVTAIRTLTPALADVGYRGGYEARSLYIGLSSIGAQSIAAGEYSAWDCLNDAYRAGEPRLAQSFSSQSVYLELGGIFNLLRIAELYAELPEVTEASPSYRTGGGSTLCAVRDGERYRYAVDRAGGDCPSGCTEHEVYGFSSDAAGQVTALGEWSSLSGDPAPAWVSEICSPTGTPVTSEGSDK